MTYQLTAAERAQLAPLADESFRLQAEYTRTQAELAAVAERLAAIVSFLAYQHGIPEPVRLDRACAKLFSGPKD